jgi:hypothetical protein
VDKVVDNLARVDGGFMDNGQSEAQDSAFDALLLASEQYEAYRAVNAVSAQDVVAEQQSSPQLPYADWAHPIGLVFNT